jgi:iron-sulfur cluster repair protein YtfE (RIC family)
MMPGEIDSETSRLVAWDRELREAHDRLRAALRVAQESVDADLPEVARDLLLYCHGFCVALGAHHVGEDRRLFPELRSAYPELTNTIAILEQDHAMIAHLLGELQRAVDAAAAPPELALHLEGLAAIMESHFRFEERKLLDILASLELDAEPAAVFGPL